jgi:nucleolar pre-ribosomal-associated protein 1
LGVAGRRRLLRLLRRLRPTESRRHAELLLAAAAADADLAAAFMSSFPWSLDPRASGAWLAAAVLAGRLVAAAAAEGVAGALSARFGAAPPAADGPLVRGLLRRVFPQPLTKVGMQADR